jgi:hypothetical protein
MADVGCELSDIPTEQKMRVGKSNFFVCGYPQCTLPVFTPDRAGNFRPWGSAVAIGFRGRFVLATAAHVFRDQPPLIGVSPTQIVDLKGGWVDDSRAGIDLAITVIAPDLAAGIESTGVQFLTISEETAAPIEPGRPLTFVGFAGQQQHQFPFPGGMQVKSIITKVHGTQVTAEEVGSLGAGFSSAHHVVSRFRHKQGRPPEAEFYRHGNLTDPHGMSGGAIWVGEYPFHSFAGITSDWNQDGEAGHLIGSCLPILIEFLQRSIVAFE